MAGGVLKKCSVTAEYIEDWGRTNATPTVTTVRTVNDGPTAARGIVVDDEIEQETSDPSFTWANITQKYKACSSDMTDLNLYLWIVCAWLSKCHMVLQFFGYDDTATRLLKEEYSKWKLTFFKPWQKSVNELKGDKGTFESALEDYMWNVDEFPWIIRQEILGVQRNEVSVDLSATGALVGDNDYTPTEDRTNARHEGAIKAADGAPALHEQGQDICENMDNELFRNIDRRVPEGFNWSASYNESTSTALPCYAKAFYENLVSTSIGNEVGQKHLKPQNEELHCPENAKTDAQKFLVYHHLYWQWKLYQYRNGIIIDLPTMQKNMSKDFLALASLYPILCAKL